MLALTRDHLIPGLCHLIGRQSKTGTDCRETLSTQLLVLPLDMSGAPPPPPNPSGTPTCLRDSLGLHKLFLSITQPSWGDRPCHEEAAQPLLSLLSDGIQAQVLRGPWNQVSHSGSSRHVRRHQGLFIRVQVLMKVPVAASHLAKAHCGACPHTSDTPCTQQWEDPHPISCLTEIGYFLRSHWRLGLMVVP